ncbi:DNA-binding transcriptional LysR family regulator [Rhizobium leguminosarum]|nr:DNA-binding transcriptional LysR family regulator [Rhizobium leguminosarum]
MIRIEGIAAFVAVVEAGSVSEAARRLRLSKSVVSERLAELEKSLGGILLHRTTRKLTLTEDGTVFLERAARIVREIEEAAADMAERRGTLSGPIRIAAPVTFGRMHLGPALYPFLAEHPEIELTLDIDDRRVDAASDGYDAIIRNGPIADSRLVAWKLTRSRRLLCASPDYLARQGIPSSLADLNGHRGSSTPIAALPTGASRRRRVRSSSVRNWRSASTMVTCSATPRLPASALRCCPPSSPARPSARAGLPKSMSAIGRRSNSSIWPIPRAEIPPPSSAPSPIT